MIGPNGSSLPSDHAARLSLNNEAHARPPEELSTRARISYIVLFGELDNRALESLCAQFGVGPPAEAASHFSADMGPFRLKWERHTEFTRYWFFVSAKGSADLFEQTALASVPVDWLDTLGGEVLVASHVELLPQPRTKLNREQAGAGPLRRERSGWIGSGRWTGAGLY